MRAVGIMQGRLLPQIHGRIQAFPWDDWRTEFDLARDLGFGSIEFIFEGPNIDRHPLLESDGQQAIRNAVERTGVRVGSICADHFMEHPLHGVSDAEAAASLEDLKRLVGGAAAVGIWLIEIPCVDQSGLSGPADQDAIVERLSAILQDVAKAGVSLALETDLPPLTFRKLLDRFGGAVGANYDSGNSSSLGFDPRAEIKILSDLILNVHVKDRIIGGGTVPLGDGHARLDDCFATLAEVGYQGEFILQVARGADDVEAARRYRAQVLKWLERHFDGD